jgi:hypothetical protein
LIDDGYQTLVTLAVDPDIKIWEKSVTPPGFDGGDAIDITTMHNVSLRTKAARALVEITDITFSGAYAGASLAQIRAVINVETTITVHMPDGYSIAQFGFLKSFEPGDHTEGEMPEGTFTVVITSVDETGAEQNPVITAPV